MAASPDDPARGAGARKVRLPRSRRVENPEARMSLVEHIRELRSRVLKALLGATAGIIVGWFLEPPAWRFLQHPYCRLPHRYVLPLGHPLRPGENCPLVVNGLFDGLFLHFKIAIALGIILSSPIWLYQIWAFIAPGLHARERRWTYFFAGSAIPLFAFGGTLAYFAMTKGLRFLLSMVPSDVIPLITVNTYLSYAMAMLLIFGLAFELPLVMILLNLSGILTHQRFRKWRRIIIFGVCAFAAVATPSPDPISMLLLAVPCVIFVEVAEVFAWANDRRKAKRGTVYAGLTPDEVTEYGLEEQPVLTSDYETPR